MACLTITITPAPQAGLSVSPTEQASVGIEATPQPSVAIEANPAAVVDATPTEQARVAIETVTDVRLEIAGVCSVSSGTIVVLAASDGPLRTRDGGYFLLNPATNPPED